MHFNADAVSTILGTMRSNPARAMNAAQELIQRGMLYPPQFTFDQGAFCRRLIAQCPEMQPLLFHLRFIGVVYDVMVIGYECDVFTGWTIRRQEDQIRAVLKELSGENAKLLLIMLTGTVA